MLKLKILYKDEHLVEKIITRFSDLSTHKSNFYYYEEPYDDRGKGTGVKRDDVKCVEITQVLDGSYGERKGEEMQNENSGHCRGHIRHD